MSETPPHPENIDDLRQRKELFDHTWMLAIVLSVSSILVFWYLGLGQVDVPPIIGTLATLALLQFAINTRTVHCGNAKQLRSLAQISQLLGICVMAVAWHLFGGLQQPMFPLFIMLPLLIGPLILNFWQQQAGMLAFLAVLASGVLLSPDTNSFIQERYGLSVLSTIVLPAWIPRSRVAFLDVSTSPTYNLMLTGSLAILAVALTATARAMVALSRRAADSLEGVREEVKEARELYAKMVDGASTCEVLVTPATGRIVLASQRFMKLLGGTEPIIGKFLLDTMSFAYPIVIKRLMTTGGEEIQGASAQARDLILRIRAALLESGNTKIVRMSFEPFEQIFWRGAVDSLEQPLLAVNSRGKVIFLNRTAVAVFGAGTEGAEAAGLFDKGAATERWWDIAPLESARRLLLRGDRSFLASIRRERVAESIGELSFVQLTERESAHVLLAS